MNFPKGRLENRRAGAGPGESKSAQRKISESQAGEDGDICCCETKMNEQLNLKDAAFAVYSEWGPNKRIPREKRLKEEFPRHSYEEIESWISEFKKADDKIWQIAEGGGDSILGKEFVISKLQAAFPFLLDAGLKQARFLVNYHAFHEGYDKTPRRGIDTLC